VAGSHRVLYPHPVAEPAQRLLLVEGEPDLIAARSHQLPAVAIPGVNGWQAQWASLFAGRDVFIALDCDAQGRASAHRIAGDLCRRHVRVELVDLDPGREDGYDLTDWLHEHPGHGRDLLADPPSIAAGTT
jgi:DNA primase